MVCLCQSLHRKIYYFICTKKLLQQDYELRQSLATLQESIQLLDQPSVAPRTEVVLNVLNYAREVVETGA